MAEGRPAVLMTIIRTVVRIVFVASSQENSAPPAPSRGAVANVDEVFSTPNVLSPPAVPSKMRCASIAEVQTAEGKLYLLPPLIA